MRSGFTSCEFLEIERELRNFAHCVILFAVRARRVYLRVTSVLKGQCLRKMKRHRAECCAFCVSPPPGALGLKKW